MGHCFSKNYGGYPFTENEYHHSGIDMSSLTIDETVLPENCSQPLQPPFVMFIQLTECEAKTRKHSSQILLQLSLILIAHFCVGVEVVLALTLLPSLPYNSDVLLISLDEKHISTTTKNTTIDLQRGTGTK
jgi:hypothetical protein